MATLYPFMRTISRCMYFNCTIVEDEIYCSTDTANKLCMLRNKGPSSSQNKNYADCALLLQFAGLITQHSHPVQTIASNSANAPHLAPEWATQVALSSGASPSGALAAHMCRVLDSHFPGCTGFLHRPSKIGVTS